MKLESHNMRVIPEVTHYDNMGNKIKTITYPSQNTLSEDSNIELILYEKTGEVKDKFTIPFRSFSGQWGAIFFGRVQNVGNNIAFKDTGGTNRSVQAYNNIFAYQTFGTVNNSTGGVVVGASGSAVATQSIDLYKLQGQITHGTSVGQLVHAAQIIVTQLTGSINNSYNFSITRTFTNNSTDNVNIKEVGVYGSTFSSQWKWMMCRDVKDSNGNDINVTVSPGQVLTVRYNFYVPPNSGLNKYVAAALLSEMRSGGSINGASDLTQTDYWTNVTTATSYGVYTHYMFQPATYNYNGVCVGLGDATESAFFPGSEARYIEHGTTNGTLYYNDNQVDSSVSTYSTSGSAYEWNVKRTFTNFASSSITVKEAFIMTSDANTYNNNSVSAKYIYARKLTGNQTIVSGSSLEVNFKFIIEM